MHSTRSGSLLRTPRVILAAMLAVTALLAMPASTCAVSFGAPRVLASNIDLAGMSIDGDLVAYRYYTSRSPEIEYLKVLDLQTGTERVIGQTKWTAGDAVLSNGRIAYVKPSGKLFVSDLSSSWTVEATPASAEAQSSPTLDGDLLVWQDNRAGDWDLYMKDLESGDEQLVAGGPGMQSGPKLSGSHLIWFDTADNGLYYLDLAGTAAKERIATFASSPSRAISGDRVVWIDKATNDILTYNVVTKTTSTLVSGAGGGTRGAIAIDGDFVVWETRLTDYGDIAAYDIAHDKTTVWHPAGSFDSEWGPRISGSSVVFGRFKVGSPMATGNSLMIAEISDIGTTQATLSASASNLTFGAAATFSASVTGDGGTPSAGRAVQLWSATAGAASRKIADAVTDSTGKASFTIKPSATATYQVRVAETESAAAGVSASVRVSVKALLSKPVVPLSVKRNVVVTLKGTVRPAHRARVTLVIRRSTGAKYKTVVLTSSSAGAYSYRMSFPAGKYKIWATHTDAGHSSSTSGVALLTVK